MTVEAEPAFEKDVKKVRDKKLKQKISEAITCMEKIVLARFLDRKELYKYYP